MIERGSTYFAKAFWHKLGGFQADSYVHTRIIKGVFFLNGCFFSPDLFKLNSKIDLPQKMLIKRLVYCIVPGSNWNHLLVYLYKGQITSKLGYFVISVLELPSYLVLTEFKRGWIIFYPTTLFPADEVSEVSWYYIAISIANVMINYISWFQQLRSLRTRLSMSRTLW